MSSTPMSPSTGYGPRHDIYFIIIQCVYYQLPILLPFFLCVYFKFRIANTICIFL